MSAPCARHVLGQCATGPVRPRERMSRAGRAPTTPPDSKEPGVSRAFYCPMCLATPANRPDQRARGAIELRQVAGILVVRQRGIDLLGDDLAQLHAPLVERVDAPEVAEQEDLVLVQRDQRTQ